MCEPARSHRARGRVYRQGESNCTLRDPTRECRAFNQFHHERDISRPLESGVGTLFQQIELLVQNRAGHPVTIGGIALWLALVASIACDMPAKHATRLDPLIALRRD